ncbi:MAG TPA: ADP-ribosylglycohydrolase family protein [Gemmatales bacterium]|nr:ADP-ribosylglycohydrolase family protein [Gemmatales bacterium]
MHTRDQILGCILGGAIGDAHGAAVEGLPPGSTTSSLYLTDDTQLTLATCESLTHCRKVDPAHIAATMLAWHRKRRLTGLGASTLKALQDLDAGGHWALSGRKGDQAAGNGAAIRIAPLSFLVDPQTDDCWRIFRDVSRITHYHDEACAGAYAIVHAIHEAQKGELHLGHIAAKLPDTSVKDRLLAYAEQDPGFTLLQAASQFGSSGYVVESVPLALFAASKVTQLGFVEMVKQVIYLGGDTDSNASMAGQVAGVLLVKSGLPQSMINALPELDHTLQIANEFADSVLT